ncbi:MAG: hypothetical protein KDI69_06180 [Xanthomonadales bacterium]|nr:hypothetical protein [Xanthomonadales bacterium]
MAFEPIQNTGATDPPLLPAKPALSIERVAASSPRHDARLHCYRISLFNPEVARSSDLLLSVPSPKGLFGVLWEASIAQAQWRQLIHEGVDAVAIRFHLEAGQTLVVDLDGYVNPVSEHVEIIAKLTTIDGNLAVEMRHIERLYLSPGR